jgi:hypothetical protein
LATRVTISLRAYAVSLFVYDKQGLDEFLDQDKLVNRFGYIENIEGMLNIRTGDTVRCEIEHITRYASGQATTGNYWSADGIHVSLPLTYSHT